MDLTQLQMELKEVEKHLAAIRSEIDNLKPKEETGFDFDCIDTLAKEHPISYLKIKSASEKLKSDYVSGLSFLLLNDSSEIYEGLLYITRIAFGIGLTVDSKAIYTNGLSFDIKKLNDFASVAGEYKYSFLVEALIIANLCKNNSSAKFEIIAEIAQILECDIECMTVIAQLAKNKLTDDFVLNITSPSENQYSNKFIEYIPDEWLISQRKECAKLCIDKKKRYNGPSSKHSKSAMFWAAAGLSSVIEPLCVVKERACAGKVVKKGDILAIYANDDGATKKITSDSDGLVYFIKNTKIHNGTEYTYLYIYIVSFFDDYDIFCKWFNKNHE